MVELLVADQFFCQGSGPLPEGQIAHKSRQMWAPSMPQVAQHAAIIIIVPVVLAPMKCILLEPRISQAVGFGSYGSYGRVMCSDTFRSCSVFPILLPLLSSCLCGSALLYSFQQCQKCCPDESALLMQMPSAQSAVNHSSCICSAGYMCIRSGECKDAPCTARKLCLPAYHAGLPRPNAISIKSQADGTCTGHLAALLMLAAVAGSGAVRPEYWLYC